MRRSAGTAPAPAGTMLARRPHVQAGRTTMNRDFEKPPVRVSKPGASSVAPADILRSVAGQREIQKTVTSGIYRQKHGGAGSSAKK